MDSLEIREAYLDLRTAIFARERADWRGSVVGLVPLWRMTLYLAKRRF